MTQTSTSAQFGLSDCAKTVDSVLRAIVAIATKAELATLMAAITNELGFRHYALIHHDDLRGESGQRVKLFAYPSAAEERIIGQGTGRRDPVIRACAFRQHAFLWSELPAIITFDRRDRAALASGALAGLNEGITIPFHFLGECTGSCTFAGTKQPKRISRVLGMAQMIGIFAFQAARRLTEIAERDPAPVPKLHPRPRDCVALAGRGMSNKEIARVLALRPRTVDGYLTEARSLFDVHGRTELVASALLAGEIGLHELARRQPE